MSWCGFLPIYPIWNTVSFLNLWVSFFHQLWEIFSHYFFKYSFLLIFRNREEGGRERERLFFFVPLIHAFIGGFLYVPWLGLEPTTFAYRDDPLTSWAARPGLLQLLSVPLSFSSSVGSSCEYSSVHLQRSQCAVNMLGQEYQVPSQQSPRDSELMLCPGASEFYLCSTEDSWEPGDKYSFDLNFPCGMPCGHAGYVLIKWRQNLIKCKCLPSGRCWLFSNVGGTLRETSPSWGQSPCLNSPHPRTFCHWREKEREREAPNSCLSNEPQLGIKPATLWRTGWSSSPLSHSPARA